MCAPTASRAFLFPLAAALLALTALSAPAASQAGPSARLSRDLPPAQDARLAAAAGPAYAGYGEALASAFGADGLPLFFSTYVNLTIKDLTSKSLLMSTAADADLKDTKIGKGKFPQQQQGDLVGNKRLAMRAKKDGAAAMRVFDREWAGDFICGIRAAVDPNKPLNDGETTVFLEIQEYAAMGGTAARLRLVATWDEASSGFVVSAEDQDGALGDPVLMAGTPELGMSMEWSAVGRSLFAFDPSGFDDAADGEDFSFNDAVPRPDALFKVAFGVTDMPKGAQAFFAWLSIQGPLLNPTLGEILPAYNLHVALGAIEWAWTQATGELGPPNLLDVQAQLELALGLLEEAKEGLGLAEDSGELHPTTQTKLANRSMKRGIKRSTKGEKKAEKLEAKGSDKTTSLAKLCNKARWEALLTRAQLFGFKSKSIDHYFDTLILEVDVTIF